MTARLFAAFRGDPGTAGLYLFAATMHASRSLAVLGCLAMFWGVWRDRRHAAAPLASTVLSYWVLAIVALAVLRALLAVGEAPDVAVVHGKAAARFVYFVGVLPAAWFIAGDQARLLRVLGVALGGFLLARLVHLLLSLELPLDAWLRERPGLGLEPIALGYYSGGALLAVLIFLPRSLEAVTARWKLPTLVLAVVVMGVLGLFTLWSQSRGAWLALLPCLATACIWLVGVAHGGDALGGRLVPLLTVLAVVAIAWNGRALIVERFTAEPETLQLLLRGNLEAISSSDEQGRDLSIGTRVTMLRAGMEVARQRPWLGHGPGAPELILAAHPDRILRRWNDFHSAPVDLLVRFGVVGILVFGGAALATVACGVHPSFRRAYDPDVRLLLWLAFALLLLSSLSNFRMLNFDWRYWLFLFAGAMASPVLRERADVRSS